MLKRLDKRRFVCYDGSMKVTKDTPLPRGVFRYSDKVFGIRYTDAAGKRHSEKAGTLKMAERLLLHRQMEALRKKMPGSSGNAPGMSMNALIDDAVNYVYTVYSKGAFNVFKAHTTAIRSEFGEADVSTMNRQRIINWLNQSQRERGWKGSTRNRYQVVLSTIFRVALDNKKIGLNPVDGISRVQDDSQRIRFLSVDEEKAVFAAIGSETGRTDALMLSLQTGMRHGEQMRCVVGDYDPATNMLAVRQTKVVNGSPYRYVPMTPYAVTAYNVLASGKAKGDSLCGEAMVNWRDWFGRALDKAGVTDYSWHCNRHTFASRLVMAGVPMAVVANYMGHSSVNMTMRYSHLIPKVHDEAIAKLMSYYET